MNQQEKNRKIQELKDVEIMCDHYAVLAHINDFSASFMISGLLAATFKTLTAPLERIKLILQTQASSRQMMEANKRSYSGFVDAVLRIPREQGYLSFWRGNFINICRYFPAQAINFSLYDIYYRTLVQIVDIDTTSAHDIISFLAGGGVGVTSCVLLYPLTFCSTRLSVDVGDGKLIQRQFNNLNDCASKVFVKDGHRGLYRGVSCSAAGMFFYRATYFGIYTTGKRAYFRESTFDPTSHINAPFLISLLLAQVASIVATVISYPLDTIARQMMVRSGEGLTRHTGVREVTAEILRKQGPVGLYKGVFTNLLTTVCGSLILVSYDIVIGYYQKYVQIKDFEKNSKSMCRKHEK